MILSFNVSVTLSFYVSTTSVCFFVAPLRAIVGWVLILKLKQSFSSVWRNPKPYVLLRMRENCVIPNVIETFET